MLKDKIFAMKFPELSSSSFVAVIVQ